MTSNTQLRTRLSHAGLSQGARVVGFVDTMSTRLVGALSQRRDLAIGLCLCVLPTYRGHDPVGLGPKAIMRVPEIPGAPGWISQLFTRAKSRIALRASQRGANAAKTRTINSWQPGGTRRRPASCGDVSHVAVFVPGPGLFPNRTDFSSARPAYPCGSAEMARTASSSSSHLASALSHARGIPSTPQ